MRRTYFLMIAAAAIDVDYTLRVTGAYIRVFNEYFNGTVWRES